MTPSSSAASAPAFRMPVTRLRHYEEALGAMSDYMADLRSYSSQRRLNGLTVTDQDQPDEVYCLLPPRPEEPPVAIVGGMGPFAGGLAFRQACARFRNSRAVVLYQACSVPDRSTVILGERPDGRDVAARLSDAVQLALKFMGSASQPARCVIACNSAHYFWQPMLDRLRETRCAVRMISLVQASVDALRSVSCKRTLLLTTEGARVGRVFSAPCYDAGIPFEEPSPALGRLLMRAIFEGMKSLDEQRAAELGNEFFERVLESGQEYDCILAGCTELPFTIDLLRNSRNPAVMAFLSRVKIVDPVEEALCRV